MTVFVVFDPRDAGVEDAPEPAGGTKSNITIASAQECSTEGTTR